MLCSLHASSQDGDQAQHSPRQWSQAQRGAIDQSTAQHSAPQKPVRMQEKPWMATARDSTAGGGTGAPEILAAA